MSFIRLGILNDSQVFTIWLNANLFNLFYFKTSLFGSRKLDIKTEQGKNSCIKLIVKPVLCEIV